MSSVPIAGVRVLVIEDEMLVAMVAESIIEDAGCTVVGPAGRLDRALKLAAQEEIDVALLDINLGSEPVFPVAEVLARRNIPFAFATGYGAAGVPPRFSDRPVLTKPYRPAALLAILEQLCRPDEDPSRSGG
jgi:CheY-like chemotaxis protein